MYLRRFFLLCPYTALLRWGIFCVYIVTIFSPFSSRSDHHYLCVSTVPMPLKSSAHTTCLEVDVLLRSFHVFLSHAKRGVMPSAYIAIPVASSCVGPVLLLILWIVQLEYEDLLVTSSSCWYMLILMSKVFLHYEEMPSPPPSPDILQWKHLRRLPLILPLCFLYWTFHKQHE